MSVATNTPDIYKTPPASHMTVHQHTVDHRRDFYHPYGRTLIVHYNRRLCAPPKCHGCKCTPPDRDLRDKSVGSVLHQMTSSEVWWEIVEHSAERKIVFLYFVFMVKSK